jgi:hypothetical protein
MTTTSSRRRPSRTVLALCSGVAVGAVTLGGVASANGGVSTNGPSTTTTVVNPTSSPVPVRVMNPTTTVTVGNLPATQKAEVLNFPAVQQVAGTVKVDDTEPLKVQSVDSAAVAEPFAREIQHSDGDGNVTWAFTVPDGKDAELHTVSVGLNVPAGQRVGSVALHVLANGTQVLVPMQQQGSMGGYDLYVGTQQFDSFAKAGQEVMVQAFRDSGTSPTGTAFMRGSVLGRFLSAP